MLLFLVKSLDSRTFNVVIGFDFSDSAVQSLCIFLTGFVFVHRLFQLSRNLNIDLIILQCCT